MTKSARTQCDRPSLHDVDKVLVTAFDHWLFTAEAGSQFTYFASTNEDEYIGRSGVLFRAANEAREAGLALLVQKRTGRFCYEYVAIRTKARV